MNEIDQERDRVAPAEGVEEKREVVLLLGWRVGGGLARLGRVGRDSGGIGRGSVVFGLLGGCRGGGQRQLSGFYGQRNQQERREKKVPGILARAAA